MGNILFEGFQYLVFQLLAFIRILNLTTIYFFKQFLWSVNNICQVYKLYFSSEHVQNFGQYFYLSVFVKQLVCPILAFVIYMLYSHCTQNCILCTFQRLKTLVLRLKDIENLLIFVHLFCPKNSKIDSRETSLTQDG